jgi:hypothetical protein
VTVAEGDDFFVNWADVPSVDSVGDALWAHWLVRGPAGGYDYGIRVAHTTDGGETWSEPRIPHYDDTPTEHGFVSFLEAPDGRPGLVWLDGRAFVEGDHGPATEEMSLRWSWFEEDGPGPSPGGRIDARTCDCCPTAAASTDRGPVVVYRDRDPDEIRDISIVRWEVGAWSEPRTVHPDGWEIAACPVNGPAVSARGSTVAVAWFTAAGGEPAVKLAFSGDAGDTFAPPLRIDGGDPVGRVDLLHLADGSVLVSWIEGATGGPEGKDPGAEIRVRRAWPDGTLTEPTAVVGTAASRASGFPRMMAVGSEVLLAWTRVGKGGGVETLRLDPGP